MGRIMMFTVIMLEVLISPVFGAGKIQDGLYEIYTTPEYGPLDTMANFRALKRDGAYFEYYSNGDIKKLFHYSRNHLDGACSAYYESGKLRYVMNYQDGKREGKALHYDTDGTLRAELNYRENVLDGTAKLYDKLGILQETIHYRNGTVVEPEPIKI